MNAGVMNALVYEGPKVMKMRTAPIPALEEGEVLIKVQRAGICGSELGGYLGRNSLRKPPLVMGHEFSGEIARVSSSVSGFQPGDRVTANPLISCWHCRDCEQGRPQLCRNRKLLGAHLPGAYAEYVKVPARNVHLLPESVSMDAGAMCEPFACAIHICNLAGMTAADQLLIMGAGPIGLFVYLAARLYGLQDVVVMDINEERLEIARELGAKTASSADELLNISPGAGFDCAVDAVGVEAARAGCAKRVRPGGKIVFTGLHEAESRLPVNDMIRSEIITYGAFAYTPQDFALALQWINEAVRLTPWIEHLPLQDGALGFEKLTSHPGKVAKILLTL